MPPRWWRGVAALVALPAVALVISNAASSAPGSPGELFIDHGRGRVAASYVGLHIHRAGAGTAWPRVPFAGWRLHDANVAWSVLQPARGVWNWEIADRVVRLAEDHRVELILPLGLTPVWASARPTEASAYHRPGLAAEPADLEDWRSYVETVTTRYRGRVQAYEIWNEPNLRGFFTGDIGQMLQLCREAHAIIKRVDPAARVISPSAAGAEGVRWLERFLAAGGASCFDIIGYHFYVWPDPPEAMVPLIGRVQDVLRSHNLADHPLWNTETGWYIDAARPAAGSEHHPGELSEAAAAAALARALILARAAGVERFYWYAWDNKDMGLVDEDGRSRPPAIALAEIQRWLVGAYLDGCRRAAGGTWSCELHRDGRAQWIVWSPSGQAAMPNPLRGKPATRRDLSGATQRIQRTASTIPIGPEPQLVGPAP